MNSLTTFDDWAHHYYRRIHYYCYQIIGHHHEAEDATQEIFLKLHEQLERQNSVTAAWLYKVAYRTALNFVTRQKWRKWLPFTAKEERSYSMEAPSETDAQIQQWLQPLSLQDRTIFLWRTYGDLSFEEISDIVQLNRALVRKRYERARAKIRQQVEGER